MTARYDLVFVHSIPFWHNTSDGGLYYYDPESITTGTGPTAAEPLRLGSYNKDSGRGELVGEGELRGSIEPGLDAWRASLAPTERGKPIQPAAKPSRARRAAAKSPKTSRGKSA
jgi:hypothetical protein